MTTMRSATESPSLRPETTLTITPIGDRPSSQLREITPDDLRDLQRRSGYPMVSILVATTPGSCLSRGDRTVIDGLIRQSRERLASECPVTETGEMCAALDTMVAGLIDQPTTEGIALLASDDYAAAYTLRVTPQTRVAIDPTFATRDLARSLAENPPLAILILTSQEARIVLSISGHLHEIARIERTSAGADNRRGHLHQGERTHRRTGKADSHLRQVDEALGDAHRTRDLPIILVSAEPTASRFRKLTSHAIAGVITGNHAHTGGSQLSRLVRPVTDEILDELRADACGQLERAIDHGSAAIGIDEVWTAATNGAIRLLLVDCTYQYRAVPSADHSVLMHVDGVIGPDVLDDAVDEIIEMVSHHGGHVRFTRPGNHSKHRIAAVLSA